MRSEMTIMANYILIHIGSGSSDPIRGECVVSRTKPQRRGDVDTMLYLRMLRGCILVANFLCSRCIVGRAGSRMISPAPSSNHGR
jgi:hypothetical protein